MANISQPKPFKSIPWIRRLITYTIVLLIGFALGFVPMWLKARQSASSLSEATNRASLATMQSNLASAVIDAQRGDYESARIAASSFFTSLRDEANKVEGSSLSQTQKDGVESVFTRRDETISLLARSDPAAIERLSDLYVLFRDLISK